MAILAFQKPDKVLMLEADNFFGKFEFRPLEPEMCIRDRVIDDTTGKTLAAASSLKMDVKAPKKEIAAKVGEQIAKVAQEAGVQAVVFDRNGYLYHGRIKELADAARNGGLKF